MYFYTTQELQELLKINTKQARALMRTEGFPSVRIGRDYRVEQGALSQWLTDTKQIKLDYSKC